MVAQCFHEAGLPDGVLNFVTGGGGTVGDEFVTNAAIRAVSFTGSNEVGVELARQASALHKKCQCEMGGKNPMVVLSDADLELAVDATVQGAFGSTGQRCTATSRAIVDRSRPDDQGRQRPARGRADGTERRRGTAQVRARCD
jgi:aldehyde dehydrogenase (NAD+)